MAAEVGNFTRAAVALGMTQPNVTRQIRLLEQELRSTLFERDGRNVRLTAAGEVLREQAGELRNAEQRIRAAVYNAAHAVKHYQIGGTLTAGAYVLPHLLQRYLEHESKVSVAMQLGNTRFMADALQRRRLELALVEGPFDHNAFIYEKCLTDELVFVQGINQPAVNSLVEYLKSGRRLLLRESGSGTRYYFEQFVRNLPLNGLWRNNVVEIGSFEAIKSLVADGFGATVISELAIKKEREFNLLKVEKLAEGRILRDMSFIYLPENAEFAEKFIHFARSVLAHLA